MTITYFLTSRYAIKAGLFKEINYLQEHYIQRRLKTHLLYEACTCEKLAKYTKVQYPKYRIE